jgi:hypothetical protein
VRPRNENVERQLKEIAAAGYTPYSNAFHEHLYRHPEDSGHVLKFAIGTGGGLGVRKYSAFELFGANELSYYYDVQNKRGFEKHLESLFKSKNPYASGEMLGAFTQRLHQYNLHWTGCEHRRKSPTKQMYCVICGSKSHIGRNCPNHRTKLKSEG